MNETKAAPQRIRMNAADREQQILAGAVAYFAQHGLEAQTRQLAAHLGITHALLYHYFPTKQALIERVYEEVIAQRWNPRWEALLDAKGDPESKFCTFYGEYLPVILTPEWLRIFMYSGMSDRTMPGRYFALLRERLFPRLLREARRAHDLKSRSRYSERERQLLMGLHGGLVYNLGIMPICYGEPTAAVADPRRFAQVIADQVHGYLAEVGHVLGAGAGAADQR